MKTRCNFRCNFIPRNLSRPQPSPADFQHLTDAKVLRVPAQRLANGSVGVPGTPKPLQRRGSRQRDKARAYIKAKQQRRNDLRVANTGEAQLAAPWKMPAPKMQVTVNLAATSGPSPVLAPAVAPCSSTVPVRLDEPAQLSHFSTTESVPRTKGILKKSMAKSKSERSVSFHTSACVADVGNPLKLRY